VAPEQATEAAGGRLLRLEAIHGRGAQVSFTASLDGLRFTTSLWTEGVDFDRLAAHHGRDTVDRLLFHIAAFEIDKLVSLAPDAVDFGPWSPRFQTAAFEDLWLRVVDRVWAQWRWENGFDADALPRIVSPRARVAGPPLEIGSGAEVEVLAFCGGGKDSLVAAKLLEETGTPFASFVYLSSIYGSHRRQERLIAALLRHLRPATVHRQWIFDDFLDAPVLELGPDRGIRTLCAAETPASLFAALPLALSRGYRHLILAHERSADRGNGVFAEDGREINHQWGKSSEAERMLDDYLRGHLVADASYSSLLKPLWDVGIFRLLGRWTEAVPATHSCNVDKPWCLACPKCAYVWIQCVAFLPEPVVRATFGDPNLADEARNLLAFRQMLGLEEHTPFECVGLVDEARLAFALARRRGLRGLAVEAFEREVAPIDVEAEIARLSEIDDGYAALPEEISSRLFPLLRHHLGTTG